MDQPLKISMVLCGAALLFSTKSNLDLAKRIIKKSNSDVDLIEIDKDDFVDQLKDRNEKLCDLKNQTMHY